MLIWVLLFFQIFSGLVAGQANIRETAQGAKSLEALSNAGLFFLRWRAYADYKKELIGLRNIFGISTVIFSLLLFAMEPIDSESLFRAVPGTFLILWLTMQFGTDFKKSVKEQFFIVGLMAVGPWLMLGMDYLDGLQFNQLRTMVQPLNFLGIQNFEDYKIAMIMSIFGMVSGIFLALFSILFFSMVPLFFLFLMVMLALFSRSALKIPPTTAKNIALLYSYLIGPILMVLETQNLI